MKKFAVLLLALLLCVMSITVAAAEEVTVKFRVTANPNNATIATISYSFDSSVLEYKSSSCSMGMHPGSAGGRFVIYDVNSGISTGTFGSVTFTVKPGKCGTFSVGASVVEALNIDNQGVSGLKVSGGSVTIEHSYESSTTPATCGKDGETVYTCSNCGDTYSEPIPATGEHSYEPETTDPTCADDGETVYTCSGCGDTYSEPIPATGEHSYESETTDPTCADDGETVYTCSGCGDTYSEPIPATGEHSYESETTDPTCADDGETVYTCSECGDTYSETIPATGDHPYESETTDPTCTEPGETVYTCPECGDTYSEPIEATGHSDTIKRTLPTCTKKGKTIRTCSVCGDVRTSYPKALGHDFGLWTVTKAVTETEAGEEQRVCANCGEIETRVVTAYTILTADAFVSGVSFADVTELEADKETFAAIDLTVDGKHTFDLIGDCYIIGTVTVEVVGGKVTVTYELVSDEIKVNEEFLTVMTGLDGVASLDKETMTAHAFGEAIDMGENTVALIYIQNVCEFRSDVIGLKYFELTDTHVDLVEAMKEMLN